jgi:hypothetical protein
MPPDARIDKIRARKDGLPNLVSTHSEDCWQWHTACMARILLAEIDSLIAESYDDGT